MEFLLLSKIVQRWYYLLSMAVLNGKIRLLKGFLFCTPCGPRGSAYKDAAPIRASRVRSFARILGRAHYAGRVSVWNVFRMVVA